MRFVRKKVLIEDGRSTWSLTLGALFKQMFGSFTKHTTREAKRVTTFEVGVRVHGISNRLVLVGLIPAYSLLSRGQEVASGVRLFIQVCSRWRDHLEGVTRSLGGVFQLFQNSPGYQTFLSMDDAILAHSCSPERAQSRKMGGSGDKS